MKKHKVNKVEHYGWPIIVSHWLSAVLVCSLFGLGLYMVELTYYDPLYRVLPEWHKLLGLILVTVTLFRLVCRFAIGSPQSLAGSRWARWSAQLAHGGLYVALFVLPASGYLMTTADGAALSPFGLITVPGLVSLSSEQAELMGDLHRWAAYFIVALAVLHGLAALIHHFVYRDNTLLRMIHPTRFSIDRKNH